MARKSRSAKPTPCAAALAWLERRSLPLAVALVALATVRIVATYTVFTHTSDEPAHIACGMEWLDKGVYRWEAQHPPLARVATALGPYLLGIRSQGGVKVDPSSMLREGLAILYHGGHYDLTLSLARLGVLPFFWIACAVVYGWAKRDFGPAVAVLAVFLFTFLPIVLAHAGLATTDMALTAFLGAAFLTGTMWLESPTWKRALVFGVSGALMVLAKFSCFAFFPVCVAAALACHWYVERPAPREIVRAMRRRLPTLALAVAAACLIIWAGYRFSVGPVPGIGLRLPAYELALGIQEVAEHNAGGHNSYLLGERSKTGFWCYFEVAMAVKTPLAFLLLLGIGTALAFGRPRRFPRLWLPLAFASSFLLVGLFSRINIGLRHILPIFIGLAIVAAAAVVRGLETAEHRRWRQAALASLVAWLAASSLLAHPDYLPYFNELAGSQPEKIMVDSDLDWGQDIKRAARRLRELGAREVAYEPLFLADLEKEHGFPKVRRMDLLRPEHGWNLVSFTHWKQLQFGLVGLKDYKENSHFRPWPDRYPPGERVGKSMMLWYAR
jgi:hypothetical protein